MGAASRLSVNGLGVLLNAWKRWKKFCHSLHYNYQMPTPVQTAEFLRDVARGGPTAASGMHACLKWFAVNLGAGFQMDPEHRGLITISSLFNPIFSPFFLDFILN